MFFATFLLTFVHDVTRSVKRHRMLFHHPSPFNYSQFSKYLSMSIISTTKLNSTFLKDTRTQTTCISYRKSKAPSMDGVPFWLRVKQLATRGRLSVSELRSQNTLIGIRLTEIIGLIICFLIPDLSFLQICRLCKYRTSSLQLTNITHVYNQHDYRVVIST
jgi:hypothetical protein